MNRPSVTKQPTTSQHLQQGIDRFAQLLAPTFGPTGGHVAYLDPDKSTPELIDDSATVVRRIISLGDPTLDIGAMIMRNLVWRVGERAGDGGAMACILAHAIFTEALRMASAGLNVMQLARGIRAATETAVASLRAQAWPVATEDELSNVALTVTKERPLAAVIGELSALLGPHGHVVIQDYVAPFLEWQYIGGAQTSAQIASMYLYSEPAKSRTVLTNPAVAVLDEPAESADEMIALLEMAVQAGASGLLIVGPRFGNQAVSVIVANYQAQDKKLTPVAVQVKGAGELLRQTLADLALLSGATLLGGQHERNPGRARPSDLGQAQRAEITKDGLVLVPTREKRPTVEQEIEQLRARVASTPNHSEDRENLTKRLAMLSGGVGYLKIGAGSKGERILRHSRAERALRVASMAQQTGVVPGGGAALLHAADALDDLQLGEEAQAGVRLLQRALAAPMTQLLRNAHVPAPALVIQQVQDAGPGFTYDVLRATIVEGGILDVAGVVETVLTTAVSGALMALTTDAIVYHRHPEQSLQP
jgi:chaperonin GroEL